MADPDYCVLKFTTTSDKYYCNNRIIQFIGKTEKDISEIDFINSAESYLLKYGFSKYEIAELHKKLK